MGDSFARRKLLGILSGPWLAQAVYTLVKLGVPGSVRLNALM